MIVAAVILAQTITLDPQSGVWFPPEGWRDQYVERRRSYSKDLRETFERDPKLAQDVCTAVRAAPQPAPSVDPSLRQMRMLLDMACMARKMDESARPAHEERKKRVDAFLTKHLDQAIAATENIAPNERKTTQRALLTTIDSMPMGAERLAAIFRAIVLRPQDARGAWLLLRAWRDTTVMNVPIQTHEIAPWVEQLYRTRAAAMGPDALNWESGFAEVLLYLGKDEEARRLQTDLVTRSRDVSDYDRILLAVLDEIAGRSGAVRDAFPRCVDQTLCRDALWSFATRTAEARSQTAPRVIGDFLAMTLPWYPDKPVHRYTTGLLIRFSPARARQEITSMYMAEEIGHPGMCNLVLLDAQLASAENDPLRTIALRDCWLTLHGVRIAAFPADAWPRLAALPEPKEGESEEEDCSAPEGNGELAWPVCASQTLIDRLHTAIAAKETGLARQSVEKIVAHTLAGKLPPSRARHALFTLAQYIRREVSQEEAARIVRYLDNQPLNPIMKTLLNDFRPGLPAIDGVVFEPWTSSGADLNRLPRVCGDSNGAPQ